MPFPDSPLQIHGGCSCRALRYKISLPAFPLRAPNPYKSVGASIGELRLPMVLVCHCNDCRRATGASVLPMPLVTEIKTVTACVRAKANGEDSENWQPAEEVWTSANAAALEDTYLKYYRSSEGRNRWFCGRCGTNLGYSLEDGAVPKEWGWPKMLDIWLGTVDREDLEKEWMRPERRLWCDMGIDWVKRFADEGTGHVPAHPLFEIDKLVGNEGERV